MAYISIPLVPSDVMKVMLPSENPYVTAVNQMIGHLNKLGAGLPQKYGWRYRTSEGFLAELNHVNRNATDLLAMNNLYWRDQLGNWEAYSLMNSWRVIGLARSCVWALNRQDILSATLLGRSALETAAQFVDVSRMVTATICGPADGSNPGHILRPDINLREVAVTSNDLEQYSLKTIFASRLPDTEKIYEAFNIIGIIKRISKVREQGFVLETYEKLCEVAHPNMLGRLLHLQDAEPGPWEGNELRIIGPGNGLVKNEILEATVAALSWACGVQASATQQMAGTISAVIKRLEEANASTH